MQASELMFSTTLKQLESSLSVQLVAGNHLRVFETDESSSSAFSEMNEMDFSQAPVSSDGQVVGVIDREDTDRGALVAHWMKPLSASHLISSQTSLREVIRILASDKRRYRLILTGSDVTGIVTRSDLQKLPVRLLAFSYVTHLETLFTELILSESSADEWVDYLRDFDSSLGGFAQNMLGPLIGTKAVEDLYKKQQNFAHKDVVPPLVEVLEFSQKWYVVCRALDFGEKFAADMAGIQRYLRNPVAHSRNYVSSDLQLEQLNRRLEICEEWIEVLTDSVIGATPVSDSVDPDIRIQQWEDSLSWPKS
ncbi:MAG: CBS domain-containing protein [Thermomicrobiales bacterium]|nr:CBS domain-containing protein [Thermomicrobiales bacterium]